MAVVAHGQGSFRRRMKGTFLKVTSRLLLPRKLLVLLHGIPDLDKFQRYLDKLSDFATLTSVQDIFHAEAPAIAFTFDDGMYSSYRAIQILEKRNIRSAFFISTGLINSSRPEVFYKNNLRNNPNERPATWAEINELAQSGHIIGSHSVSHPLLTNLNLTELSFELSESKNELQQRTGQKVTWFANPFGDIKSINETSAKLIFQYYDLCFTGVRGIASSNSKFILRQSVDIKDSIEEMIALSLGGADLFYKNPRKILKQMEKNADLVATL
jgi:peptidoglycan/xylan/chitin deacetylase (PgdA/CDA1 family)